MFVVKRTDYTVIQILRSKENMRPNYGKTKNISYWLPIKKNKIGVAELKASTIPATFQESLRVTLIIGQIFSLLPVNGVYCRRASQVRFTWRSWKCFYLILCIAGQIFIVIMCAYKMLTTKATLNGTLEGYGCRCNCDHMTLSFMSQFGERDFQYHLGNILGDVAVVMGKAPLIFYTMTAITMVVFMRIARLWPDLAQHIAHVDVVDRNTDLYLVYRCNITCAVILILALLEHILSLISAYAGAMLCRPKEHLYRGFLLHFYPWVFDYWPYSLILGIITQLLHFQATFIWNFCDLFVICISYYLTSRLQHINKKLLDAQGKYLPESFWRITREDYGRAVQVVRKVDDVISGVVFISFANNLFFICLQLYNTLDEGFKGSVNCNGKSKGTSLLSGYEATVYFLFSLFYLLSRAVAASLIVSQVNVASTVPATVLYGVPSPVFCVEVQRFLDQVNGEKVALSGLQFFSVTRSLLLTVAGTIVTYELVMLQFSSPIPEAKPRFTTVATLLQNFTTDDFLNFTNIL